MKVLSFLCQAEGIFAAGIEEKMVTYGNACVKAFLDPSCVLMGRRRRIVMVTYSTAGQKILDPLLSRAFTCGACFIS